MTTRRHARYAILGLTLSMAWLTNACAATTAPVEVRASLEPSAPVVFPTDTPRVRPANHGVRLSLTPARRLCGGGG